MNQFKPIQLRPEDSLNMEEKIFPNENNIQDIVGFIRTLSEDPSSTGLIPKPRNFSEQLVIVTNGGSTSAYFYDTTNTAWKKVTLT